MTWLSVLLGEDQMLVITWSQTASDQKRGKLGKEGEREGGGGTKFRCDLTCTARQGSVSAAVFGLSTHPVVK